MVFVTLWMMTLGYGLMYMGVQRFKGNQMTLGDVFGLPTSSTGGKTVPNPSPYPTVQTPFGPGSVSGPYSTPGKPPQAAGTP